MLEQVGFDSATDERFTKEMSHSLPKWSDVLEMYGKSKALGSETCKAYQESVKKAKWKLAVIENFNSGTNFLHRRFGTNEIELPKKII